MAVLYHVRDNSCVRFPPSRTNAAKKVSSILYSKHTRSQTCPRVDKVTRISAKPLKVDRFHSWSMTQSKRTLEKSVDPTICKGILGTLGSITSSCSGKWASNHFPFDPPSLREGSKTGPGRRREIEPMGTRTLTSLYAMSTQRKKHSRVEYSPYTMGKHWLKIPCYACHY